MADNVLRAITDDGAFRVITARTTSTVGGAVRAQGAQGRVAGHFGDLLTGAILFRETMAPQLRVQGILKATGGSLVADSHPSGDTRGLVQADPPEKLELDGASLRVARSLPDGRLSQGVVRVPESGGISGALMEYMQTSEQVFSMLAVGTILSDEGVVSAGGYMVQLLPEADQAPLAIMTERLRDFEVIDDQLRQPEFSADALLNELLYGMPFTRLDQSEVAFGCWCSQVRVISALATLPRRDIEDLVEGGDVLEISCDYCGAEYQVAPEQLRGLLEES